MLSCNAQRLRQAPDLEDEAYSSEGTHAGAPEATHTAPRPSPDQERSGGREDGLQREAAPKPAGVQGRRTWLPGGLGPWAPKGEVAQAEVREVPAPPGRCEVTELQPEVQSRRVALLCHLIPSWVLGRSVQTCDGSGRTRPALSRGGSRGPGPETPSALS